MTLNNQDPSAAKTLASHNTLYTTLYSQGFWPTVAARVPESAGRRADSSARECLVVRLSALGDAILTTGVLQYWHETAGLCFHVLTRAPLAPVFARHPAVISVLAVEEKDLNGLAWVRFCRALAAQYGHLPCLDLHGNLRTRALRALWPGLFRVYPKFSLARRLFLATRHPFFSAQLTRYNVPQRYSLALETSAPPPEQLRPRLFLSEAERAQAQMLLTRHGLDQPVAIHPYATHPAKTPSPEVWKTLVAALHARGQTPLILGQHAHPLQIAGTCDLTNQTDLRMTAALLSFCRCLLSGDSGPMHLATAVGTPVLAFFGPTTREWGFYPSGPQDVVHQTPCPSAPCSLHGQSSAQSNTLPETPRICPQNHSCMDIHPECLWSFLDSLWGVGGRRSLLVKSVH